MSGRCATCGCASPRACRTSAPPNELITEVESLYVNGPAGGGGVRFATRPTIRTYTAFVPRADVTPRWAFVDA